MRTDDGKYAVVIGSLNFDIIFMQKRLPEKGETYLSDGVVYAAGGKGANQAAQLAGLGVKTWMAGKTGQDVFGQFLRSELQRYGVDITHVKTANAVTGLGGVHALPDGSVYATVAAGANDEMSCRDIDELEELIKHAAAIVLQLEIPVETVAYIVSLAHRNGVYTVLNAAPGRALPPDTLKLVDCLVVNEVEAAFYTGEVPSDVEAAEICIRKLFAQTGKTVVLTLGSQGSALYNGKDLTCFPVESGIEAVDTTGCGDSYIGAFTFAKIGGADDVTACRFASLVSQKAATKAGGIPAMPVYEEIREDWERISKVLS